MIRLSKEQIIELHQELIEQTGGSPEIRDDGMLDSAINSPFSSFGGEDLFPSIEQKAARLGFGIIKNHPFVDGNKRTGVHTMLVFLVLNQVELQYSQKELYTIVLEVAEGKQSYDDLFHWIIEHQK